MDNQERGLPPRRPTTCSGASNPNDCKAFTYDALGRVLSETANGRTLTYAYDAASNRTALTWPDAGSHALTADDVYDALNAMTAIEENGATSGPGLLASLGYDGLGRLTGRTTAGGAGLSTSWAYGDNGLLSSLTQTLAGGAGTTLGFTYSAARQILTRSDSNGAYTAQPPAQSSTYAANGLNQVVSATGTRGGPAAAAGLAYDPPGRIASVTQGGSTTTFLYAGWSLVGEYSSSGAILARYVPGAGMDAPAAMYTGPGTASRAWYAADQQGSILATADASGAATLQLAYGPYGEPLTPSGASAWGESRYGYTGQIGVAGALAWFDKARMYDPAQGRFLQTDPLGLSAGTNLYAYAVQDPVNGADPWGLEPCAAGGCPTVNCVGDLCHSGPFILTSKPPPAIFQPLNPFSGGQQAGVGSDRGQGLGNGGPPSTTVQEVVVTAKRQNNKQPSPRKSPAECFAEARRNNQVAIGLDTAGLGLSLVPGANLAVAGTGLAVGTASLINSGIHGDVTAIGIGAVGYHIGAVAPAAEQFGKVAAEAIPLAGTIVAAGALGWDLYSANQEYQNCLAGN